MSSYTRALKRGKARTNRNSTRSGVYLIEFENGVKIGKTTNFMRRFREYNRPWMHKIINIWFLKTKHLDEIEQKIKDQYFIYSSKSTEFFPREKTKEILQTLQHINKNSITPTSLELITKVDLTRSINIMVDFLDTR